MTTQYTSILKLALPVQGELSGTWGDVVNDNITSMIEQAIAGRAVIDSWTANAHTLTTANGVTSESRCAMLEFTDSGTQLTGAGSVVCPTLSKIYIAKNASGQNVTLKTSGGTGILVPNGRTMFLFCDGTNVVEAVTSTTSLQLGTSTTVTAVLDEDNMASNSAVSLATQQSIKAYVDAQVATSDTLAEVLANGNTTGGTDVSVSTDDKVQFRDAAIYINSSADGQLDIVADTEIQIAATTVDVNGILDVSGNIVAGGTVDGRDVATDGTKLDGIEASADVTDTTNVTAAGALMDSEVTNLAQVKAFDSADYATAAQGTTADAALPKAGGAMTGAITTNSTFDGRDVATDGTKLDGIEASADVTDTTNVTAAGALMDSEVTNLAQVKAFASSDYATAAQGTTADAALPKAGGALTGAVTTNSTFDGRDVATDGTKLDGIEASADVTDATNVTAAGALMDSELTAIASVKALNQGVATTDSPTFSNLTLSGTDSVKVPSGTTGQRNGSPANGMFRYNSTTAEFEGYQDGAWGSIGGGSADITLNQFTGDGSDTTFTLSGLASENNTFVFIDGVYQSKSNYSVSTADPAVVTFSTAPPNTTAIEVMVAAISVSDIGTPSDNTVSTAKIVDGAVTPVKIASGDFYFDTDTLFIDATNNRVGIGTASPSTYGGKLNITDGSVGGESTLVVANNNANQFIRVGVNGDVAQIAYDNADSLAFGEATASTTSGLTTERMRIDSSGNVGIGTASPSTILDVKGAAARIRISDTDTAGTTGIEFVDSGGTKDAEIEVGNSTQYLAFKTATAERMRIDGSGNVGVGTTSPEAKLHISTGGGITPFASSQIVSESSGNNYIELNGGSTSTTALYFGDSADQDAGGVLYSHSNDSMSFRTNGSQHLSISSSGRLVIASAGGADTGYIRVPVAGSTLGAWTSYAGTASTRIHMRFQSSSGLAGYISTTGLTTFYGTSSDYRLKTDAQPMTGATARLKALKPVNFEWIADGTRVDGFLAHEAKEVVPECVIGEKDAMMEEEYEVSPEVLDEEGNTVEEAVMGTRSVPDYQGIDQSKLVPLLVATIQELEARITQLENN